MLVELRGVLLLAPVGDPSLALELALHLGHRRLDALDLVEELEGANLGRLEIDLFFLVEVTDDVFDAEFALSKALADLQNLGNADAGVQNHLKIWSSPSSMRLAISTSPSRVRSETDPIFRRYMRTGSFDFCV